MTLRKFNKFYQQYKNTFDLEMMMKNTNTTYAQLKARSEKEDEWL